MLSTILFISLRDAAKYANYHLNKDYIAQNVCVNRFEPIKMCSGVCYLEDTSISQDQNEDYTLRIPQVEKQQVYLIVNLINVFKPVFVDQEEDVNQPRFRNLYYASSYLDDIFHPPSV